MSTAFSKSSAFTSFSSLPKPSYAIDVSDASAVKRALIDAVVHVIGSDPASANAHDWFSALTSVVRGLISEQYIRSARRQETTATRRVYYLSMEYLLGRSLVKNLLDLGIHDEVRLALAQVGQDLDHLVGIEKEPGLGNGGLGRLAACFLESMASQDIAGSGYGVRYEHGTFSQQIEGGRQREQPDSWLRNGNPWEFPRPDVAFDIMFGGRVAVDIRSDGRSQRRWVDGSRVIATANDQQIAGFRNGKASRLRLWSAKAVADLDLVQFNQGAYLKAAEDKILCETLSRVLYPDDSTSEGRELRLKQEYFFVSASIQDIIETHLQTHAEIDTFAEKTIIQLNDTHPALGVAELMRLLLDNYELEWDAAWNIASHAFAYTNHTLMSEALERWPISLLRALLPRHLEIIFEINERLMTAVRAVAPGDAAKTAAMSLVDDRENCVRMAHLAIVGCQRVNGVARLHTDLLKSDVFPDFVEMYPDKFVNVTNGITPRRWLLQANPGLSALITEHIGEGWMTDLTQLSRLMPYADDAEFREQFRAVKSANRARLGALLKSTLGIDVPDGAIVDVQIKRIHEYKRQLLNVLHVITLYNRILDGKAPKHPRVVVFAGKAAPSYHAAKLIVHLINDVARTVNSDPRVGDRLKVAFLPNYGIASAEILIPGADVSQQISTAGTEASGTGNMKFALNGAHTIGTWDGANIEIAKAVGLENITIFGMTADEVATDRRSGNQSWQRYAASPELARVLDMIGGAAFCPEEPGRYGALRHGLLDGGDYYKLLADYTPYILAHQKIEERFSDPDNWAACAVRNVAAMGPFSVDRAVREYADNIWHVGNGQLQ